jgi:hypothetical protein
MRYYIGAAALGLLIFIIASVACKPTPWTTKRVAGYTSECNLLAEDGSICRMVAYCRSVFAIEVGTPFLCRWR